AHSDKRLVHHSNVFAGVFGHQLAEMLDNPEIVFVHNILLCRSKTSNAAYYTAWGEAASTDGHKTSLLSLHTPARYAQSRQARQTERCQRRQGKARRDHRLSRTLQGIMGRDMIEGVIGKQAFGLGSPEESVITAYEGDGMLVAHQGLVVTQGDCQLYS